MADLTYDFYNHYPIRGSAEESFRDYMTRIGMGEDNLANIDLESFSEDSDYSRYLPPVLVMTMDGGYTAPKFSDIPTYAEDIVEGGSTSLKIDFDDSSEDTNISAFLLDNVGDNSPTI